ncbi:MAG: TonB-dependent receptor [Gammaproteobacteria bacterium]|nr:TonB-dependent receptor [Gammaproteobacteria bacterium]
MLLLSPTILAQQLEEIVVTAQKRAENMQDVPISIQSLGNQKLKELNIQNFQEYAKILPSVAMTPSLGAGAGFTLVYMRGIATAGDGQATTSQPSVGMYLDELPITTIQGNLDIHTYDIARVEALSGPQGTLYGASSQAGTIRIITNKPDLTEFDGGFSIEGNLIDGGDTGYVAEGFANIPLSDTAAIRLVGWSKHDAGYIDNVLGSRTFPGVASTTADDITVTNERFAKDDYNTIDTIGGRASLRIDLNEDWTVTPTLMAQKMEQEGSWGEDLSSFVSDELQVKHFQEEFTDDEWVQLGLTIEGKIGNFDVTYAGAYLDRDVQGSFDYSDYSYWYDTIYTTGYYADLHFSNTGARTVPNQFFPDAGTRIWPGARFTNDDGYKRYSHELRVSSPQENRLRGMVGFYVAEQKHDFEQHWEVAGLADIMLMNANDPGGSSAAFKDTVYLNSLDRKDTDEAIFGHLSYDLTEKLEATVGVRFFKPEVTVVGFFGFGLGFTPFWSSNGENRCTSQVDVKNDAPCQNVDKGIKESESIGRVNFTYKIDDDKMVYATWSEGYRPGGINRSPDAGEYVSDFLTNWELGWKTQWMDNRLQLNGAVFFEEWDDFQVSFVGANAITQVANGPTAEVTGLESQIVYAATDNLRLSASFTLLESELQDDYCPACNSDGTSWAPAGTSLPVTADFKGNAIARYGFDWRGWDAHMQGTVVYEGERGSSLNQRDNAIRGDVPSSTLVDLSAGIRNDDYAFELFIKNATDEDAPLYLTSQCATGTCGTQNYSVRARPRTFGLRFTKEF